LSTALGLSLLQAMRSAPPRTDLAASIWDFVDRDIGGVIRNAVTWLVGRVEATLTPEVEKMRRDAARISNALVRAQQAKEGLAPSDRVARILLEWRSKSRKDAVRAVADKIHALAERHSVSLLRLLETTAQFRSDLAPGLNLQSFLKAAMEYDNEAVDIVVTGHSKGGALSSTLALWLADTQGEVSEDQRWDPHTKARVHCFSYAGPTAGNQAFVDRSNAVIGPRCHRIANTLDIVPHAWTVEDLRQIPDLYGPGVDREPIKELVGQIVEDVAPLGYHHVGQQVRTLGGRLDSGRPLFFDQLVYQHLDGYLTRLDLGELMSQATFFSPLV
jgi:hypothetical protein